MSATTEADRIEAAGRKAGEAIWSAIEAAYDAGLSARRMRHAFGIALEAIAEDVTDNERPLFQASAYEAIPHVLLNAVERAEISRNAWDAYDDYLDMLREHAPLDAADHHNDMRREVAA